MVQKLQPFEVSECYQDILKMGIEGLKGIEVKQALQVREEAAKAFERITDEINGLLILNPDYNYPDEYKNGREVEYWQEKRGIGKPLFVLETIDKFLNKPMENIIEPLMGYEDLLYKTDVWNVAGCSFRTIQQSDRMNFQREVIDTCQTPDELKDILTEKLRQWKGEKALWIEPSFSKLHPPKCSDAKLKILLSKAWHEWFEEQGNGNQNKPPQKGKAVTYQWQGNANEELPKLYKMMVGKFIDSETTLKQFTAIFTGQPIESIIPIKWHDENASELLCFNEAINKKVDEVWNKYKRLTACFVKPDGKPFVNPFAQLKTNLSINLSQTKQTAIDKLVKRL